MMIGRYSAQGSRLSVSRTRISCRCVSIICICICIFISFFRNFYICGVVTNHAQRISISCRCVCIICICGLASFSVFSFIIYSSRGGRSLSLSLSKGRAREYPQLAILWRARSTRRLLADLGRQTNMALLTTSTTTNHFSCERVSSSGGQSSTAQIKLDPSAGSPTETLLRLLLPLNVRAGTSFRQP